MNLTPQDNRVLEPADSADSNPSAGYSEGSPQLASTAHSWQTVNPLILEALPTGGMKSPCTGAIPSLYTTCRETIEQHEAWLDAIARDRP